MEKGQTWKRVTNINTQSLHASIWCTKDNVTISTCSSLMQSREYLMDCIIGILMYF